MQRRAILMDEIERCRLVRLPLRRLRQSVADNRLGNGLIAGHVAPACTRHDTYVSPPEPGLNRGAGAQTPIVKSTLHRGATPATVETPTHPRHSHQNTSAVRCPAADRPPHQAATKRRPDAMTHASNCVRSHSSARLQSPTRLVRIRTHPNTSERPANPNNAETTRKNLKKAESLKPTISNKTRGIRRRTRVEKKFLAKT